MTSLSLSLSLTWGGEVSGWFKYITFDCALRLPCGSEGKASACNAGDLALIPGLGRSAGEGIGYPLQYSWAFLVAQLVKKLLSVRDTWV